MIGQFNVIVLITSNNNFIVTNDCKQKFEHITKGNSNFYLNFLPLFYVTPLERIDSIKVKIHFTQNYLKHVYSY